MSLLNKDIFDTSFASEIKPMSQRLLPITHRPDICFVRGQGDYLYDSEGKVYLDMIQGWAVNTLGHSPPQITQAIRQQAETLMNPGPAFYNYPMLKLANLLSKHSVFDQVFFANSGAEANESAIKLARKWGQLHKSGAYKILCFDNGFHGRTLATMSATGKQSFEQLYEPKVSGFCKVPFNNYQAVKNAIDQNTVGIMLELVQGEAGVIPADQYFIKQLRTLCDEHKLLLIVDEVQTGIGRTGSFFCHQQYGITPDIVTLGKGLGGGFPISAMLTHTAFSCFEPGDQGGTFNGNPLACAAAHAVVSEIVANEYLLTVQQNADYLKQQLKYLAEKCKLPGVRGMGMLLALNTGRLDAPEIIKNALNEGLLLNAPRKDTLRFMPALNISKDVIDQAIDTLHEIIKHA